VVTDIVLCGIAEELKFSPVGKQYDTISAHQMEGNGTVFEKILIIEIEAIF
jgi:hypothetical protein